MDDFDVQSLSVNQLQSSAQSELLSRLDDLRKLGFSRRLLLPQLVLCGDQSSGKSSVFEALTGVSLPVNDGLCTRFATEVVFTRSNRYSAQVKIRPGPAASPEHRRKLSAFARSHNWLHDIRKLVSEARLIMDLVNKGSYSQDVLQLEVSGPSLPDLTVVDLPGMTHLPGPNQTPDDVFTARQITESYMRDPRNILLAVVAADTPFSQQTVMQAISAYASRTMVILTKPDILEPGSASEDAYYTRLRNQDTPFRLGWHLLRNTDTHEVKLSGITRDDIESMFVSTMTPWKYLCPSVVGIDTLRHRLSKVILSQAELQLTTLSSAIEKELAANQVTMDQLGPCRRNSVERRLFLTNIAERFTSLTKGAVLGDYHDPYFRFHPSSSIRRLRSIVRTWADAFATDMETRGHSYIIYDDSMNERPPSPRNNPSPDDPQPLPRSEVVDALVEMLQQSRSRDVWGLRNARIVGELFIRHSTKWSSMAKAHVFEIWKKVKLFLDDILHYIAGEAVGGTILREMLKRDLEASLEKLNQKVEELMLPYKKLIPATVSRQLNARLEQLRRKSGEQRLADLRDDSLCQELLDCMLSYYSVALGNFVDNVANLAVESCLLDVLEDLITPCRIADLTDEEVERLTTESLDVEQLRNQVSRRIRVLEIAASACAKCETSGLEAAARNYRTLTMTPNRLMHVRSPSNGSTSSTPPLSPATDISSSSLSRVSSLNKRSPITPVRPLPPPTRLFDHLPPPEGSPPPPPTNVAEEWPRAEDMYHEFLFDHNVPTQPPPMIPPRSLQRSHSLASDSSGSRKGTASSTSSVKEKRSSKSAITDQKSSLAWASAAVGVYALCV